MLIKPLVFSPTLVAFLTSSWTVGPVTVASRQLPAEVRSGHQEKMPLLLEEAIRLLPPSNIGARSHVPLFPSMEYGVVAPYQGSIFEMALSMACVLLMSALAVNSPVHLDI
ncbi:hypothetical protein N658DRAFT_214235 [Parathielavia hyrcaniae]|uniref:Secreted protein n=1 Tax=Parathielavia hyrcaniae TaxID=113614 RepID=A0AAN6PVT1_9PEZI|nr:hypothetical protein N658DRAFT_214235 [Parathielavia hyrcaniae]